MQALHRDVDSSLLIVAVDDIDCSAHEVTWTAQAQRFPIALRSVGSGE